MTGKRQFSPAAARNREPILDVLRRVLPSSGLVLEVASGTGEHAAVFAPALPGVVWQPSDAEPSALASIEAWVAEVAVPNLRAPIRLSATEHPWDVERPAAIFCANMIHIAPWEAALGLLAEAGRLLPTGAPLVLYGPFKVDGEHTAPSNAAFDESLRARNPAWGVRDRTVVARIAVEHGLRLEEAVPMPANNQTLVFRN